MSTPLPALASMRTGRHVTWTGTVLTLALSGLGCVPVGVRHLIHLFNPPADLYEPIFRDDYFFALDGAERSYLLEPRYVDYYELGLRSSDDAIPKAFQFPGIVRLELFAGDDLVEVQDLTRIRTAYHAKNGSPGYERVALASFVLPASRCNDEPTTMRLTVVEPAIIDDALARSLEIYVAVAATP